MKALVLAILAVCASATIASAQAPPPPPPGPAPAHPHAPMTTQDKADAQTIDSACAGQDSQTAGCGNEQVHHGLLKCLHAYKVAHQGTHYSEACENAIKALRQDRKNGK